MKPTFQDIIQRLHAFWSAQGCLLWQPYSEKVGAGTMNPATVLGVLGEGEWKVAYIEPSYRPDDGRFGENPNRMQMHTQYQVVLKPDPGDPQELYLKSLEALGITSDRHDIRFVEDNWESPALGAWGLGWEVWLDGLEITQFTYFQQAAGQSLTLPAVEITYGLERIAMFLQKVRSVWDLDWNGSASYRDVLLRAEVDHCRYDFQVASIERLLEMYRLFEEEARACIEAGVVIPAFDYVLRCSHTFNVLDARGAIGVTERASYFGRMRDLTRRVAELYIQQREGDVTPERAAPPASAEAPASALGGAPGRARRPRLRGGDGGASRARRAGRHRPVVGGRAGPAATAAPAARGGPGHRQPEADLGVCPRAGPPPGGPRDRGEGAGRRPRLRRRGEADGRRPRLRPRAGGPGRGAHRPDGGEEVAGGRRQDGRGAPGRAGPRRGAPRADLGPPVREDDALERDGGRLQPSDPLAPGPARRPDPLLHVRRRRERPTDRGPAPDWDRPR